MAMDKPVNKINYLVRRGFSIAGIADFTHRSSAEIRAYRRSPDIDEKLDEELQNMVEWVCEKYGTFDQAKFNLTRRGKHLQRLFNRQRDILINKEKRAKRPKSLLQSIKLQKIRMAAL